MKYFETGVPAASSVSSSCAASAPLPAPNSITVSVPLTASACATCFASARPNSGDSSGAVTKSEPCCGIVPNLRRALA